jgi:uncharacterized protein YecT (DUF1311 family)
LAIRDKRAVNRRRSRIAALFLCLLLIGIMPRAAAALDCENAETTVDMIKCADRDFQEADERLRALYTKLHAEMDETARTLLRDAQRAWLVFRDAECERARDVARGGTLAPVLHISCLADLTEQRIGDLEGETDLSSEK